MASLKEKAVRARARVRGYSIHKSRDRSIHSNNRGEYMLIAIDRNAVVLGDRFDASLADIADYLSASDLKAKTKEGADKRDPLGAIMPNERPTGGAEA
jgi:hypothetical protein